MTTESIGSAAALIAEHFGIGLSEETFLALAKHMLTPQEILLNKGRLWAQYLLLRNAGSVQQP